MYFDLYLENLELENLNKEEKHNRLRKQENFWIHTLCTAYPFGLNDRVAKYGDKFSKSIGQMIFNYKLILKRLYSI